MTITEILEKINPEKKISAQVIDSFCDINMSDESFYTIIDFIDGNNNLLTNSNKIKSSMIRLMSPYILDKFKDKIDNVYDKLDESLSRYNKLNNLSDSDYSELIYHIISLGKSLIEMTVQYPQTALKIIERNEVKTLFELSIPEKEDYQNISEFYYHEWAEGLLNEIKIHEQMILKKDLITLRRITRILELISKDDKIELKKALGFEFDKIDNLTNSVIESSIPIDYSFQNLIFDYYGFMLPFIKKT